MSDATCKQLDCERPVFGFGLCSEHWGELVSSALGVRPEVARFALAMEERLAARDEDRGDEWRSFGTDRLFERMGQEIVELAYSVDARHSVEQVRNEAADVGNFLMFVAETVEAERKEEER